MSFVRILPSNILTCNRPKQLHAHGGARMSCSNSGQQRTHLITAISTAAEMDANDISACECIQTLHLSESASRSEQCSKTYYCTKLISKGNAPIDEQMKLLRTPLRTALAAGSAATVSGRMGQATATPAAWLPAWAAAPAAGGCLPAPP